MYHRELATIRQNPSAAGLISEALSALYQSGVLNFLYAKGRVGSLFGTETNDQLAIRAARSAGYMEALDDIIYFRELYLESKAQLAGALMDFGGIDIALKKGLITEEEADGLRKSDGKSS